VVKITDQNDVPVPSIPVTIGCSLYALRWLYLRWIGRPSRIPVYD
jgi:hypothetical protein